MWLLGRLTQLALVVAGVLTLLFVALRLSGDPVALLVPPDASRAAIDTLREEYGLDDSIGIQYVRFVQQIAGLEFEHSITYREPAMTVVLERVPRTLALVGAAMLLAVVLGFASGVYLAVGRRRTIRGALELAVSGAQSVPTFVLAIMLLIAFGVWLQWFPTFGFEEPKAIVLPAASLAALQMAKIARLVRALVEEVAQQDFVRTAYAKGLSRRRVMARHILPHTGIGVLTLLGVQLSILLGGAVVVETVFSWPGIGRLLVDSVAQRDYPVVQAAVLLVALGVVLINAAVDLLYFVVDPRLRQ